MELILGVDGGGTKTEFLLCSTDGTVIRRKIVGKSNSNDIGMLQAQENLKEGIFDALSFCKENNHKLVSAFFGLAAGTANDNREILANFFKPLLSCPFDNEEDTMNALNVGHRYNDGISVICGTGSVITIRKDGKKFNIGGYGSIIDDFGSGYDFGHDMLSAIARADDGIAPKTILKELFEEKYGNTLRKMTPYIFEQGSSMVASLASFVFKAYRMGDAVAVNICEKRAEKMSYIITKAVERYGKDTPVALVGGIFSNADILVPLLKKYNDKINYFVPELKQIYGAILESARIANIQIDKNFEENFKKSYQNFC